MSVRIAKGLIFKEPFPGVFGRKANRKGDP